MSYSDSTIFVTGGAGFIGSHLVRKLLNEHVAKLTILDSLEYGTWGNLLEAEHDPRVELLHLNLKSVTEAEFEKMLDGVDYLFHLAAEKHNQSVDSPDRVLDVNVSATRRLFEAAGKVGVKKLVFTSSLYANGQIDAPRNRPSDPVKPWTVYGVSKLAGEGLVDYAYKKYDIDHAVFRLYFIYGPRQYAGMGYKSVINKNFERILGEEAPTIYGSGTQCLDYLYVDDIVDLLIKSVFCYSNGKVFNTGSEQAVNIISLTDKMLEIAKSNLAPLYTDADWTDGTFRVGDTSDTNKTFDWEPEVPLDDGLKRVYSWLKNGAK